MRAPKSFEEGMNRLEAILDQMQQPETTLQNRSSCMPKRHR